MRVNISLAFLVCCSAASDPAMLQQGVDVGHQVLYDEKFRTSRFNFMVFRRSTLFALMLRFVTAREFVDDCDAHANAFIQIERNAATPSQFAAEERSFADMDKTGDLEKEEITKLHMHSIGITPSPIMTQVF